MGTDAVSSNTNPAPASTPAGAPAPAPAGAATPDLLSVLKADPALHRQYTEHLAGAIREQDGKRLRQIQALEEQVGQLPTLQARLLELQEQAEGKSKTTEQRYQAQVQQLEQQRQTLAQQLQQTQANTAALEQRRADDYRRSFLMGLAAESGAALSAIPDIPHVFPANHVQVEATADGGFQARLVDPSTGLAHTDPRAAFATWLGTKPHLKAALSGGAGQQGAGIPAPRSNDPLAGLTPGAQQIESAFFGHKK